MTAFPGPAGALRCTSIHAPAGSWCSTATLAATPGAPQQRLNRSGVPAGAIGMTVPPAAAAPRQWRWP